ncbi:hypothetical protein QQS21_002113 [Conoideocrella luteorostrata]|uniref:Uncharacterized protein n=1 Tax=Conoideocrella luteorostrata TaxID=1105319 RepID=A0AAJ0FWV4_9HYPO|nr:hypothetical protein QQS21_002113 [Conoideocrella luteorostrata]
MILCLKLKGNGYGQTNDFGLQTCQSALLYLTLGAWEEEHEVQLDNQDADEGDIDACPEGNEGRSIFRQGVWTRVRKITSLELFDIVGILQKELYEYCIGDMQGQYKEHEVIVTP